MRLAPLEVVVVEVVLELVLEVVVVVLDGCTNATEKLVPSLLKAEGCAPLGLVELETMVISWTEDPNEAIVPVTPLIVA